VFLEAAKLVLERNPGAFFLCIGHERQDRTFRAAMQARAEELGIAERVTIAAYDGPIGDVWQLIDIHAHASLFDSLPNAIIEGMSVAKASVVTDVGDVAKMVDDERTGIVVMPNDPAAFARALLRLIEAPDLRHRFAAAARARYLERHQPNAMAERLENLFLELAAR
jgi:glycosyltransferase involved in cell wall biosynthesis